MPFNSNITPGRPPVLWSEVNDAFVKVNENFDILVATIGGGSGLTPIDFTSLDTSVKPTTDNLRDLGDITHKWRAVFTGEHTTVDPLNGVWAGNAQVKGVGYTINLPDGSTVGGDPLTGIGTSLIIDPDKTFFKEIQVNNDLSVVATTFGDTVNFLSGSGIGLAVSSGADSITFSNTGILSVTAGSGITAATVSGVTTITNAGVRSLQSTTALPAGRSTGAGVNIDGSTGDNLRVTNTGVISISSGVGITVSLDAASGDVTITNSLPASLTFSQVSVNGSTTLVADATNDILNITSDATITLTATAGTDTVNIAVNPAFDLKGSVFGDDSSVIVNAIDRVVTASGGFIGNVTGDVKGSVFGDDSTKIVDAVENKVFAAFFGNITGNVTGNAAGDHTGTFSGNVFSNLIDSADSSEINIVPSVNCNSDLTVGGNILPSTDLGGDLGSVSQQWNSLFVSGSTIFIGGVAVSVENGALSVGGSATQEILVAGTNIKTINGNSILGSGDLVISGTVTSVSGTAGRITSTGGATPVLDLTSGIATAGTTGSVSLIPVVTIDTYGRVTSITTAANPQGTVTSVAALTLGTTGTDLTSTVANGTTTPVITLNIPTASATNRGALSSGDWTTFNNKGSGTVTSVTGTAPVASSGGTTPVISMAAATTSVSGYLTSTDWTTFNNKGSGTVTSVAATVPSFLSVSGSPITTSGTLAITLSGTALPVANGGTGVTASTGSGSVVLSTSPALTTPVLGTPTSGTLSNCTVDGTDAVGFRNVPVNSQSASYTLVLTDSGKTILHPSSDANARTFTIPSNATVPYPIGTIVTFINMTSEVVTIAINTDTMYLASVGTTGSRSLAQYGSATALKINSTNWFISGNGLV